MVRCFENVLIILRRRLADERGFTMLSAVTSIMVGTLLSLGAWQTANSDIRFTDNDRWDKVAYQYAQSGVSDYVQHIAEASSYWSYCDQPPGFSGTGLNQTALNDTDIGTSAHPQRRWLPFATAGSATDRAINGQYTIDLVPANGASSCKSKNPRSLSMIDQNTGMLRVRVTGRAGQLVPPNISDSNVEAWRQSHWTRSSVIVEFRRNGFLNYGYFTDHESKDPDLSGGTPCRAYYQDSPGDNDGRYRQSGCTEIQFANGDSLSGPFHTNDSVLLASFGSTSATFGLNPGDRIEVYNNGASVCAFRKAAVNPPSASNSNCTNTNIDLKAGARLVTGPAAKQLLLPESDEDLLEYADPASGDPDARGLTFYGRTRLDFDKATNQVYVTNALVNGGVKTLFDYPTSGVIYVARASGVSSCNGNPDAKYPGIADGCALAEVDGTYTKSVTVASQDDLVILPGGLIKGNTAAVAGLIANDYVRIRHYGYYGSRVTGSCYTASGETEQGNDIQIDAAILTLSRSFTVDAYSCGRSSGLGKINLTGSLAQEWRGTVGYGSYGYIKNYVYDYNLRSLAPPHFLSPTTSTWLIARTRNQLPACICASTG